METPAGRHPAEPWQWEALKTLLINHFANFKKPPDPEALKALLFAVGLA